MKDSKTAIKKPMLASVAKMDSISFPVLASPKLDGIRCIKVDGKALTRSLKPIPNRFVRDYIETHMPDGVDGEICLSDPTAIFRNVSSAIMSFDGEPDFVYHAFDYVQSNVLEPFTNRYNNLITITTQYTGVRMKFVPHKQVDDMESLLRIHSDYCTMGYEGTMVRSPTGPYKNGRATVKEGHLLKIKDFADEEGIIIDIKPLKKNMNEAKINELGYTARSSAQDGLQEIEALGSLDVQFEDGTTFSCGSGLFLQERLDLWKEKDCLIGRKVKIKYQPPRKPGESPRFPVFCGFRDERDI